MPRLATILAVTVLGLAAGVAFLAPRFYPERTVIAEEMEAIVPVELGGWTVRTLPIADTEALRDTVNRVLRYDSAVVRSYEQSGLRVTVYAAHWRPGKASRSDVGMHTPDTCWILAGWQRTHREHAAVLSVDGRALQPAETATFVKEGTVEHVMFWHLAGGRPITFEQFGWDQRWPARLKRGFSFVRDLVQFGLDQRSDQCFVRISCDRPIPEALRDPHFRRLVRSLAPLGIFASAQP